MMLALWIAKAVPCEDAAQTLDFLERRGGGGARGGKNFPVAPRLLPGGGAGS
jgi:hypothetical protein